MTKAIARQYINGLGFTSCSIIGYSPVYNRMRKIGGGRILLRSQLGVFMKFFSVSGIPLRMSVLDKIL